jgi:histidinol dehydrogenase
MRMLMTDLLRIKIEPLTQAKTKLLKQRQIILTSPDLISTVKKIVNSVKTQGDEALHRYSKSIDKVDISTIGVNVNAQEIQNAYRYVSQEQIDALITLRDKIHAVEDTRIKQLSYTLNSEHLKIANICQPIESVGCYVPGGQANYPSSLLMTTVPAKVAGVPRIVVCSPPTSNHDISPILLVAADLCGVNEIYRVGGAQAIAAMAYGTASIPPVLKIVGPGNQYVTTAKDLVASQVAVDYPYGPSELLILADDSANPYHIALDLISQAEHTSNNVVGLITTSQQLAEQVHNLISELVRTIDRQQIVIQSLDHFGFILTSETMLEAINFVNTFAPEHLELITKNSAELTNKILSAGVILVGPYTPASASDYCFGTNHVLPTNGYSRMYSGLSVYDFVKQIAVIESSKTYLKQIEKMAQTFAESEQLPNHYQAIQGRIER